MPDQYRYRNMLAPFLVVLAGCQFNNPTSTAIADQFSASGRRSVDLASAAPGNWDRVCVFGPYSDDAAAGQTLGFQWPAETLTDIEWNEGISLLVFVRGSSVIDYVEHSRRSGDFTNLTGRCFPRANARFLQVAHPAKGWPGLFPTDEA
ncbi:hypothetical protein [Tahibacter caeni]|uniref:hypothetical protein n=1 Tax=Tahibacter caeni TaxID=1453545 RepID=UPI0021485150|nr:hypothetical protein [Tahibacter caeni]